MMTTEEVAHRLIELVRTNQTEKAYQELYSPEIESLETDHTGKQIHLHGIEAILEKQKNFNENTEAFYGLTISEPIVAGKYFSCTMDMDSKMKGWDRMNMIEVCVYKVEDGKVVLEQFFY